MKPFENQFLYWADPDATKYEISAISLASHDDDALWEFYTPPSGQSAGPRARVLPSAEVRCEALSTRT